MALVKGELQRRGRARRATPVAAAPPPPAAFAAARRRPPPRSRRDCLSPSLPAAHLMHSRGLVPASAQLHHPDPFQREGAEKERAAAPPPPVCKGGGGGCKEVALPPSLPASPFIHFSPPAAAVQEDGAVLQREANRQARQEEDGWGGGGGGGRLQGWLRFRSDSPLLRGNTHRRAPPPPLPIPSFASASWVPRGTETHGTRKRETRGGGYSRSPHPRPPQPLHWLEHIRAFLPPPTPFLASFFKLQNRCTLRKGGGEEA